MDDLIVKFCEDRQSWLFVTVGTLGLSLLFVLPCVDEYLAVRAEKSDIAEQLASAEDSAKLLTDYEQRRVHQSELVAKRLDRTLNDQNEADYRKAIVKMVRDTGCQLRRLSIGAPHSRDWRRGDHPLEKNALKTLKPTGFELERRQVSLALVGSATNIQRLIERLERQDKQVHVQGMNLKPGGGDKRRVELSLELWYFTLRRAAA